MVQGRRIAFLNGPGSILKKGGGQEEMPDGGSIRYQQTLYTGMKTKDSYAYRNKSGRKAPMWVVPQICYLSRVFVRARGFVF